MGRTILIVDDDPHILDVIGFALSKAHMETITARDGFEAVEHFRQGGIDLVVLDISMPELDGLEVCQEIRKTSQIPILFLSSRSDEIDRIIGLEIGGDDYLTKPFSTRELVARIKAILKRTMPSTGANDETMVVLTSGNLSLDPIRHKVVWKGEEVTLTATEFAILKEFLTTPERVFERNTLIERSYGVNIHVSDRTIDSHIRHIRAKFQDAGCDELIETVHGVGYRLAGCE